MDDTPHLEERIVMALKTVYDPEIPVDIYELGLIYSLVVEPTGEAKIEMTLTSPACPTADASPSARPAATGRTSGRCSSSSTWRRAG